MARRMSRAMTDDVAVQTWPAGRWAGRAANFAASECSDAPNEIECPCCEGAGAHTTHAINPNAVEYECITCDGTGGLYVSRLTHDQF